LVPSKGRLAFAWHLRTLNEINGESVMPAGYSGTPLAKKLDIKPGFRIYVDNAPANYRELLGPLPKDVTFVEELESNLDMIHVFTDSAKDLEAKLSRYLEKIKMTSIIWVSWPKKASKVPTDITEDTVREVFLPLGLVDNKVCAVSEIWSGLRVVWRKENRATRRAGATGPPG
jgi:hypothetical protein